ncbi:hypothetical protein [Anaerobutyricum hallii]|uniref:hypothetical protein n=1 Tax=Anaerobutyricum hallii TaxID=39488 RepID=UPI00266FC5C5|nr:hypothetical protein [Anaerobutyricum hallii]
MNRREITKREVVASIAIIAVMLIIGSIFYSKIVQSAADANEKYNTAIKVEKPDIFVYGMATNVGNAFVYGELKAVKPVDCKGVNGKYIRIIKIEEHYNMHEETYTTTDSKGNKKEKTRIYWSWDYAGKKVKQCKKIVFCKQKFKIEKIILPENKYLKTIKVSRNKRYKYYGVKDTLKGTIFTELKNGTISNRSPFYESNIKKTVDYLENSFPTWMFWIFWIALIAFVVYGFYSAENKWLD